MYSGIFILTFFVGVLSGCSRLLSKPDSHPIDNAFRPVAITVANNPAIPAEIANDIKLLNEGKEPEGQGAWKPISPNEIIKDDSKASIDGGIDIKKDSSINSVNLSNINDESKKNNKSSVYHSRKIASARCRKDPNSCMEQYKVQIGDTLMKISFEKYGSLFRWREIFEKNRDQIKNFNILKVGMTLTIEGIEYVVIERNGEPYLIRKNDTLGKISKKLYGTTTLWKKLWKNNPQLIKNPNKIYAGLTMYYKPIENSKLTKENK